MGVIEVAGEPATEPVDEAAAEPFEALVRLHLAGRMGVQALCALRRGFGSLEAALGARESALCERAGLGRRAAARLVRSHDGRVRAELARARALGVEVFALGHPGYPPALARIDDPPLVVYVAGTLVPGARRAALVGARRASGYGLRMARRLAEGLAQAGVEVVSGLALGVDAAAHQAALEAGGRTIAVLACGLAGVYPRRHARLAARVREAGALVSELPLDTPPRPYQFPRRNRLISALAEAVCVVEAGGRSGSLTTARWALEQGKEVLAVPARVEDHHAAGVLALLTQGAAPALDAGSILGAMGIPHTADGAGVRSAGAAEGDVLPPGGDAARRVWAALACEAATADRVIERSGLEASVALATLFELEVSGWVRRCGALWQRAR